MRISIQTPRLKAEGELNHTSTAEQIYQALPLESEARTWGEEIYFQVPLRLPAENTTLEVEIGDIAYWPEGSCVCLFFGRTPLSTSDKPKPASEVVVIGKITSDISDLKSISSGEKIKVLPWEG